MKYLIIITIFISLWACSQQIDDTIFGTWIVDNKYYNATFKIFEEKRKIKGQVIQYNDGTSKYSLDEKKPRYIFHDLNYKDSTFVDGISGATAKDKAPNIAIKVLHTDTLEVTNYINGHRSMERWIRKFK